MLRASSVPWHALLTRGQVRRLRTREGPTRLLLPNKRCRSDLPLLVAINSLAIRAREVAHGGEQWALMAKWR